MSAPASTFRKRRSKIQYLRDEGHQVEVLFVEAEESVLVRRFSETRRGIRCLD